MSWRNFKRHPEGFKGLKGFKPAEHPPIKPLEPLKPAGEDLQNAEPPDLQRMVGEALAEVDRLGRPWPARFLVDMPVEDRDQLRELEKRIDAAVISGDAVRLAGLLDEWRALLLRHLH